MKQYDDKKRKFVVCITNSEPDLELRKIYQVLPDESADRDNYMRIIDESGEDYLYPASYFISINVPEEEDASLLVEY